MQGGRTPSESRGDGLQPRHTKEKAPERAGAFDCQRESRSVPGDNRTVEMIVQFSPQDVLRTVVECYLRRQESYATQCLSRRAESRVTTKVSVEIFEAHRPLPETGFDANADGPSNPSVIRRDRAVGTWQTWPVFNKGMLAAIKCGAACHVEKEVVSCKSSPRTNSSEPILPGSECREVDTIWKSTHSALLRVAPGSIAFDTEDVLTNLPIVSELAAADETIQPVMGNIRRHQDWDPVNCVAGHVGVAPGIYCVCTDIEPSPVIDCGKRRRRSLHRHIGSHSAPEPTKT